MDRAAAYQDIYSKYPELSTRLIRTSRQVNQLATLGNCNLDLSTKEMVKIIDIRPNMKKAVFDLYKPGLGEGPGLFFDVHVFMNMPAYNPDNDDDVFYTWIYDAGANLSEEQRDYDYHVLTIFEPMVNENLIRTFDNIKNIIEFMDTIDIKTLDVRSLFCYSVIDHHVVLIIMR